MTDGSTADALQQRRRDLAEELDRLIQPPAEGAIVSFGKRVGDGTSEAVERLATTASARSLSASIKEIDRALTKLEEGTYGICDTCGEQIKAARMEARPATALCVGCAAQASSSVR